VNRDESLSFCGPETQKALENFAVSDERTPDLLIRSYVMVKLACCRTNRRLGFLDADVAAAIANACEEIISGKHNELFMVDPYQGGAGTSLNMNMNEVISWLAEHKSMIPTDPLAHVNLHQSTNDTFPTAVKIAILFGLKDLEQSIALLQEAFQNKEKEFGQVIKTGRTELQDAVPMTLGMEFGAYAEAISRDRWRIFKSRERIKTVNLGGTAVGTGLGAPRDYILSVTDELKRITGLAIARAENLVDQTQNLDAIAEVSGINKALAVNLLKIANDIKLLSSGPDTGIAEIALPDRQKGSSIMPGKVNPVIPEMVCQVALAAISDDNLISLACASGQLELNAYLPLIAHRILGSISRLSNACKIFAGKCISGIVVNSTRCSDYVLASKTLATCLVPLFGYEKVEQIVQTASDDNISIKDVLLRDKILREEQIDELLSPKRMYKLGFTEADINV